MPVASTDSATSKYQRVVHLFRRTFRNFFEAQQRQYQQQQRSSTTIMSAIRTTNVTGSPSKQREPGSPTRSSAAAAPYPSATTAPLTPQSNRRAVNKKDTTGTLLDVQAQAPSPATSFHQLVVQSRPERVVIWREWPRRRMSQRYSDAVDPSQTKVGWELFMSGKELDGKVRWVFGEAVLDKVRALIETNSK